MTLFFENQDNVWWLQLGLIIFTCLFPLLNGPTVHLDVTCICGMTRDEYVACITIYQREMSLGLVA